MTPPPGWTETKQPWQLGNLQIGDKVYGAPATAPGAPGTTPGAPAVIPPGYSGGIPAYTMGKATANINSALNGELPPDVIDQLRQHAAEFGVSSGLAGSDFSGYQGLKNLGLTSLQRQDEATKSLMPFFQTPAGQANTDQFNVNNITRANQFTTNTGAAARAAADKAWTAGHAGNVMGGYGGSGAAPIMGGVLGGGYGAPPAHAVANDVISRYLPGLGDLLGGYGGGAGSNPHGTGSYAPLTTDPSYSYESDYAAGLYD